MIPSHCSMHFLLVCSLLHPDQKALTFLMYVEELGELGGDTKKWRYKTHPEMEPKAPFPSPWHCNCFPLCSCLSSTGPQR